jgi:hypothetical protein
VPNDNGEDDVYVAQESNGDMLEPETGETKETVVVVFGREEEGVGDVFEMMVDERGMKDDLIGHRGWGWRIRSIDVNAENEKGLVRTVSYTSKGRKRKMREWVVIMEECVAAEV